MAEEERCVVCGSGEVEDVEHFLVRCDEFQWERERLLERIGEIEGAGDLIEAFQRGVAWYPARRKSAWYTLMCFRLIKNGVLTFMTSTLFRGVCSDEI